MSNLTHRELCKLAAKYLRNKGIQPYHRCTYSVCELERQGECPDAYGWSMSTTQLIEVKTSRADFLSDKKKYWRKHPDFGLGRFRSYLCPKDLIKPDELPEYWGLLYADEAGRISVIVEPKIQPSSHTSEIALICSVMRREGIRAGVYCYKKYKDEK